MDRASRRKLVRRAAKVLLAGIGLVVLVALWWFGPALYHRWWLFPKQTAAIGALATQRQTVPPPPGWRELVGACHVHSYLSHDSNGRFEEILAAATAARLDFVLVADHASAGQADYSRQWTGVHKGVRFVPGFELKHGFMPWGLPTNTVLHAGDDPPQLARQIAQQGGLLFFAHSEADLWFLDQWVPWVFTNPITFTARPHPEKSGPER